MFTVIWCLITRVGYVCVFLSGSGTVGMWLNLVGILGVVPHPGARSGGSSVSGRGRPDAQGLKQRTLSSAPAPPRLQRFRLASGLGGKTDRADRAESPTVLGGERVFTGPSKARRRLRGRGRAERTVLVSVSLEPRDLWVLLSVLQASSFRREWDPERPRRRSLRVPWVHMKRPLASAPCARTI